MTHLICSCGTENWSWSAWAHDPIALDFTRMHEAMGHQVTAKPTRRRKVSGE